MKPCPAGCRVAAYRACAARARRGGCRWSGGRAGRGAYPRARPAPRRSGCRRPRPSVGKPAKGADARGPGKPLRAAAQRGTSGVPQPCRNALPGQGMCGNKAPVRERGDGGGTRGSSAVCRRDHPEVPEPPRRQGGASRRKRRSRCPPKAAGASAAAEGRPCRGGLGGAPPSHKGAARPQERSDYGAGGRSPGRAGGTAPPSPRPLSAGVGGAVSRGTRHPLPAICGRRPPACFVPPLSCGGTGRPGGAATPARLLRARRLAPQGFRAQPDKGAVSPAAILRRRHRCEGAAPFSGRYPAAVGAATEVGVCSIC